MNMDNDDRFVDSVMYSNTSFNSPHRRRQRLSGFPVEHGNTTRFGASTLLVRDMNFSATQFIPDISTSAIEAIDSGRPEKVATKGLFPMFCETVRSSSNSVDAFQSLTEYQDSCGIVLAKLDKLISRTGVSDSALMACRALVQNEQNTWQLLSTLFADRFESFQTEEPMLLADDKKSDKIWVKCELRTFIPPIQSVVQPIESRIQRQIDLLKEKDYAAPCMGRVQNREIIDALIERDSSVRQAQLIVDWLERCGDVTSAMGGANSVAGNERVEHFMDGGSAWENTFQHLEAKKLQGSSTGGSLQQRHLVTELDPDAPTRQKRPLHDQDVEDEQRLLRNVFGHIRTGHLDLAEKIAVQQGHFWLTAAFQGWRLHHDPNMNTLVDDGIIADLQPVEGNPYRDLWKNVCWRMASDNMVSHVERAIFAVLSANLKELLPACSTWEDKLWAYIRAYVDISVEQELRCFGDRCHGNRCDGNGISRDVDVLPPGYPVQRPTLEQIFQNIESELDQESKTFYHIVQRCIILDDVQGLVEEMYERVRDNCDDNAAAITQRASNDIEFSHLLRFMAHLALFLRRVEVNLAQPPPRQDFCDLIVETYVNYLTQQDDTEKRHLVATYTATLPSEKQVLCYSKLLKRLGPGEEREKCLELAKEAGLDTAKITKKLVTDVTAGSVPDLDATSDSDSITEEDDKKIDALQWLLYDPNQRFEALQQANKLMRLFAACQKYQATHKVFKTLPPDTIDIVMYQTRQRQRTEEEDQQTGNGFDDNGDVLPPEVDNSVREYLCFQAFLEAHSSFNRWSEHKGTMPKEPGPAPARTQNNFAEWVAHEQLSKQYEANLAEWKKQNDGLANMAVEILQNVLVFADGGWMVDRQPASFIEDQNEEARQDQLTALRKLCLPQISFLLFNIRKETGQLREALRIADLIASEQYKLYAVFSKIEIEIFMGKVKEVCLDLLDQNLDPFGYPVDDAE